MNPLDMTIPPNTVFGPRIRKSPFFEATREAGCNTFTIYNHMWMPLMYASTEVDYWTLVNDVAVWDVACQRQVEINGPGALSLVQYLCPRDISSCPVGQGLYVPLLDDAAGIINDPVLLRLAPDRFWLSLADSDILLWARGIALARGDDVRVLEPDASPLAIQGPRAKALVADLFGDWVLSLRYFAFRETELDGIPLVLARSGWSKQGGFELYLTDGSQGGRLWEMVMAGGAKYNARPGTPNLIERIESGLLAYRSDMDETHNPLEIGLDRFVDIDKADDYIGKRALQRVRDEGIRRRLVGLSWDGEPTPPSEHHWPVLAGEKLVGRLSSSVFSPRLERNIGLAVVAIGCSEPGTPLAIDSPHGLLDATVTAVPFLPPAV